MPQIKRDILVVDDEPEIREMLKDFLQEYEFNVTVAKDGIEAMERLSETLPGIVITDLLMPGEHGINLVKTIKEKYFLPVIIISSIYSREELESLMEEHFVEGFIEKPINLVDLLKLVNEIIRSHQK